MPEAVRGQIKKQRIMDGNYLTAGDLALIENRRGYGYGNGYGECGCGCGYGHNRGMAATGIGLAAGLGGGALLLALAGIWGINQASKARARGMENANAALTNNLNQLATLALAERTSRETWQNRHAPSMTQYVDVQTGAGAFAGANSTSNALAQAEATILTQGLLGNLNQCPQKVSLYSAPSPCPCPTSCCNG